MQDKEFEKLLKEKADNVKLRDFSEVWADIKDKVQDEKPKKAKKFIWKKWLPLALASVVIIVGASLSPLIINGLKPPAEELFYADKLSSQIVEKDDMLDGLAQASISHVDLSEYIIDECRLMLSEDNKVKGATFTFYDKNSTVFLATMNLYDKNVDAGIDKGTLYDSTYKVNSTDVFYKFKQESGGFYEYSVYALHNNVQYVIEYAGVSDNLTEFLNEFFA